MMRRKSWILVAALMLLVSVVQAEDPNPIVTAPTMKLHSVMQTLVTVPVGDAPGVFDMSPQRMRLILVGDVVPGKVGYLFQGEALGDALILDMFFKFSGYVPNTTLNVGRFIPYFTYYQQNNTGKLDFINYPLTTLNYAQWRQVGVWSQTKLGESLMLNLGIYNGADIPNNTNDNNSAKDFFGRVDYDILKGDMKLKAAVYGWYGSKFDLVTDGSGNFVSDEDLPLMRVGGFVAGSVSNFRYVAEYVVGSDDFLTQPTVDNTTDTRSSWAALVQGIYTIGKFEVLGRYDMAEPNADTDDDEINWITVGANYWVEKYTKVGLNYVKKGEKGANEVDNDALMVQFQLAW